MSAQTDSEPSDAVATPHALAGYLTLIRPRIAVMVALLSVLGATLADWHGPWFPRFEAALYIVLVTGSASCFNQLFERDTDALMGRTQQRPFVTGRISPAAGVAFGLVLGIVGIVPLAMRLNLLSALLLAVTFVLYVVVYTPLKKVSTLNTVVGAIPGAAPPLIAYAAIAGDVGPWGWGLFAILFTWQFPHFMAIAWMYREDYKAGGHKMLAGATEEPGTAGRQAVIYGVAMIPVSLMPTVHGIAGFTYGFGALLLGILYLAPAIAFALHETRPRAKRLMWVSLAYLPLLCVLIVIDQWEMMNIG
ncbi:MAG: protoheme IX farnesyltransferase [bacterium]|nr:protoheme IX farnesyltransferase [bacterium]